MAKNEAEGKVLEKVRDVEREQGSFAEAGSEPPPHYGHDSAKSPGVAPMAMTSPSSATSPRNRSREGRLNANSTEIRVTRGEST